MSRFVVVMVDRLLNVGLFMVRVHWFVISFLMVGILRLNFIAPFLVMMRLYRFMVVSMLVLI